MNTAFIFPDSPFLAPVLLPTSAPTLTVRDQLLVRLPVAPPNAIVSTDRELVAAALASATRIAPDDFATFEGDDAELYAARVPSLLTEQPRVPPQEWSDRSRDARPLNLQAPASIVAWLEDERAVSLLTQHAAGVRDPVEALAAIKEVRTLGPLFDARPVIAEERAKREAAERARAEARRECEEAARIANTPIEKTARELGVVVVRSPNKRALDALHALHIFGEYADVQHVAVHPPFLADQPGGRYGALEILPGDTVIGVLPGARLQVTNGSVAFYDVIRSLRANVRDLGAIDEAALVSETSPRGLAIIHLLESLPETRQLVAALLYMSSQPTLAATIPEALRRFAEHLVRGHGLALTASLRLAEKLIAEHVAAHDRREAARVAGLARVAQRPAETRSQFWNGKDEPPPAPAKSVVFLSAHEQLETLMRPTRAELAQSLEAALAGGDISFEETLDRAALAAIEAADDAEPSVDAVAQWSSILLAVIGDRQKTAIAECKDAIFRAGLVASSTWGNRDNARLGRIVAAHEGLSVKMARPFLADGTRGFPCRCIVRQEAPLPLPEENHAAPAA